VEEKRGEYRVFGLRKREKEETGFFFDAAVERKRKKGREQVFPMHRS